MLSFTLCVNPQLLMGPKGNTPSAKKRIDALLSTADSEPAAEGVCALLVKDFSRTIKLLRTQRLLTASRDKPRVDSICAAILKRVDSLPIKGKQKSILKRHIK